MRRRGQRTIYELIDPRDNEVKHLHIERAAMPPGVRRWLESLARKGLQPIERRLLRVDIKLAPFARAALRSCYPHLIDGHRWGYTTGAPGPRPVGREKGGVTEWFGSRAEAIRRGLVTEWTIYRRLGDGREDADGWVWFDWVDRFNGCAGCDDCIKGLADGVGCAGQVWGRPAEA